MAQRLDSEDLWRRVGVHELRQALARSRELMERFEQTLRALPPRGACARVRLLEHVQALGGQLSGEAASVYMLAGALKQAVAAAEQTQADLMANAPEPCQCATGRCTCHE